VGNEKPHKNVKKLIEGYGRIFRKSNFLPPLVLVGVSREFLDSQFKGDLIQNIVTVTPKSDSELVKVYQNASLFIAPSLVEGFGLPVLEAMACGVAVVSSNIPALKEIVGDEGLFFNPSDSNEMEEIILKAYTDKKLREHLVVNGLTRASVFSWEATAQKTLALYKTLL
jgi:glycosyltransferase involved in cell wall biosynthesis